MVCSASVIAADTDVCLLPDLRRAFGCPSQVIEIWGKPLGDARSYRNDHGMVNSADEDCRLCQLIDGRLPSTSVYEDDQIYTLMDYQPVTPGHVLVAPRTHVALLDGLEEEVGAAMFRIAHRLSRALRRSGLRCDGVNLFLADGEAAFQEIPHVHLHVFPRYANDRFTIDADWRTRSPEELEEAAQRVRAGLTALAG